MRSSPIGEKKRGKRGVGAGARLPSWEIRKKKKSSKRGDLTRGRTDGPVWSSGKRSHWLFTEEEESFKEKGSTTGREKEKKRGFSVYPLGRWRGGGCGGGGGGGKSGDTLRG